MTLLDMDPPPSILPAVDTFEAFDTTAPGPAGQIASASELPSRRDMEVVLVQCLGQMALTSGSDVLWKQLNHQVSSLFCTLSSPSSCMQEVTSPALLAASSN